MFHRGLEEEPTSDSGVSGAGDDHGWGPSVPGSCHGARVSPGIALGWSLSSRWSAPAKPSLCYFATEPVQGSVALLLCSGSWVVTF